MPRPPKLSLLSVSNVTRLRLSVQYAKTAGGVVIGPTKQVLVVNQGGLSWSLPKGHIDPGETALEAATREIAEESGVKQLTYIQDLGSYERHRISLEGGDDTSELKSIELFLFTTQQFDLAPEDPQNPEARWVQPRDVVALLTHAKDKAFFEETLPTVEEFIAQQAS